MKYVPFYKPTIGREEELAVISTLRNGWLTSGKVTEEFEKLFCEFLGVRYSLLLNSGTSALHLAIKTIGVKKGDKVIVPVFTFSATSHILEYENVEPIFVDVDKESFLVSSEIVEKVILQKPTAIIVVDYAGQIPDIESIKGVFRNKIVVIEDSAHSLPAWRNGIMVGNIADITAFSFYATKPITTGEGGMFVTNNETFYYRAKMMRLHGINKDIWKRKSGKNLWLYDVETLGYKYNLSDVNASIGIVQLKKAIGLFRMREKIAFRYTKLLKDMEMIQLYKISKNAISSWHLYPILLDLDKIKITRDEFIDCMKERGIEVGVHFIPIYRFSYYYKKYNITPSMFPNSEWIFKRVITLPLFPTMTIEDVDYVVENIYDILNKNRR